MTDKDDPYIAAVRTATKHFERARRVLEEAIFAAYRAPDVRRTDIAEASPWTPAHVRKLVREEGIGPDPVYRERAEAIRKRAATASAPESEQQEAVVAEPHAGPSPTEDATWPPLVPIKLSTPPPELLLSAAVAKLSVKAVQKLLRPVEQVQFEWAAEVRAGLGDVEPRWQSHAVLQAALNAGYTELP